jgi:hypothetical protein
MTLAVGVDDENSKCGILYLVMKSTGLKAFATMRILPD